VQSTGGEAKGLLLTLPVQSDQKTSKFFVPRGRIQGRKRGCIRSLLKVREGKYKRDHGGHRWSLLTSLLQVLLKLG
jgi:hypothetical protein